MMSFRANPAPIHWVGGLFFCVISLCLSAQTTSPHFVDHPALTPDAATVIFAYNGDLWSVPSRGGKAERLTAMDGPESHPRVSPDGKWLAFSASPAGNTDVYLMPLAGGEIQQLTYHDRADHVSSWSWDSQTIYFTSTRHNRMATFTVARKGGTPARLFDHYFNTVHNAVPHPENGRVLFNQSWESWSFTHRKRYKGPYNPEIRSMTPGKDDLTVHTDYEGKDMWPMVDRNGVIYFVSDRGNDEYNLYQLEGDEAKRLTRFNTSVRNPNISADGSAIVFVRDYQLQLYTVNNRKTTTIPVDLNLFVDLDASAEYDVDGKISAFDVALDGKKMAFVSRGELFVSDTEGKFIRQIPTGPGRVTEVKWLKDQKTLLFTQTVGGYLNLFTVAADGKNAAVRRTEGNRNDRMLSVSNDTSRAVYLSGRDEVRVIDLGDFTTKTVAKDEIWGFQNDPPRWSPDDRYVAYTARRDFERDIFLIDVENGNRVTNLTRTGVAETEPVWSPDGKYLYFSSSRRRPSYPWGLGDAKLYRFPLRHLQSPFRADKFDELFSEDKAEKKDTVVVAVDAANIWERVESVGPRFGRQSGVIVVEEKGKTIVIYGSNHEGGQTKMYRTTYEDFESPKTEAIKGTGAGGAEDLVTAKGKHYFLAGGKITKINLAQNKLEPITTKHKFRRQLRDEFEQMYYETWANLEENFYSDDFHGVDWPALRDRYAAYLPHLTNRADLRRLTGDLLGELNTSHFGFYSSGSEEKIRRDNRTLATGIQWAADNPYRVERALADGPVDHGLVDVRPGDILTAVEGEAIDPTHNREYYFSRPGSARELTLTFRRTDSTFLRRLRPISSGAEATLRYDEWMDANQQRVDEAGDRRIAYVHMKNMGGGELNRFFNEMVSEYDNREALILDLRYNTGGNVHDDVLQFLSQRPYLRWKYRGGDAAPQPNFAPAARPIVLLINEQSLSDAEMTAAGFKELGLGTVMGTPTYRWIIFTSGKGLVDGSFYRLPSWGCYGLDGRNLEKTGVTPDVRVDNTTADRCFGRDPQLDRAIEMIMGELK